MNIIWPQLTSIRDGAFALALALVGATGCGDSDDVSTSDAGAADSATVRGASIYASIAGTHEVWRIDEPSHEVLSKIAVGMGPAILLATPDQKKLYTANWADNTISAIDVASEEVSSIAMPGRPYVIAISNDGESLYVGLSSTDIAVIDTQSDAVVRTVATDDLPASVIVSPDGKTLYVATLAGTVRAISSETGEVVHPPIVVGNVPAWITISHDGAKVFTLNFLSDSISVVDTETWVVVETIRTGPATQSIIGNVTPDDSALWVTNHGSGELLQIDADSYEPGVRVMLDGRPVGVSFNADGSRVYTTDFGPGSLDVPVDSAYLLTGKLTASGHGQVRIFETRNGAAVGEPIEVGAGATSVVVID